MCNPWNCLHIPSFPYLRYCLRSLRNESLDALVPSWIGKFQWEVDFNLSHTVPYWATTKQKCCWQWGKSGLEVAVYLPLFTYLPLQALLTSNSVILKQWSGECTEAMSQSDSKITFWIYFCFLVCFVIFLSVKIEFRLQAKWIEVMYHVLITVICKSAQF